MAGCLKRKWEAEYNLMMGKLDKEKKESDTSNLIMDKLDKERKEPENNNLIMDTENLDKENNKPDNSNSMMGKLKAVSIWIYRLWIPAPIPVPTTREVFCAISLMISFLLVACGWKIWSQELESLSQELGLDSFLKENRLSIVVFCGTNSLVSTLALILIGFWEFGWKRMFMFGLFLAAELLMIEMVNDFWLFFLPFANLRIGLYFIPWEEKKEIEESVETKPDHDQPPARHSCHKAVYQLRHLV